VAECQKVLEKAGQLVKPLGLTLVNEGSPVDLDRDGPVKVMGLELSKSNGKLVYGMGDRAWQNLEKQLLGAHQDGKPERMARRVLSGWIQANGLALENVTEQEKRISWLLGSLGFREVSTKEVRNRLSPSPRCPARYDTVRLSAGNAWTRGIALTFQHPATGVRVRNR